MTGSEAVGEYRRRYKDVPSIIASSMAGRAIVRPAELVFLGTTSLYGQRPCQYDRITIPVGPGAKQLRYEYLGRTKGIGTFQFGEQTVEALSVLLEQSKKGQQVNSVFGEGVNPRLRKIRDGLNELGLSSHDLLNHGSPRLVYGVRLAENVREYLLGMENRPRYLLAGHDAPAFTAHIGRYWIERWVLPRIRRQDVLERVARHNFVRPIRHGARVMLPRSDIEQQLLFDAWDS